MINKSSNYDRDEFNNNPSIDFSIQLIKENIKWFRMSSPETPNYVHSIRVYETLKKYWFSDDIQIAWLLHDTKEDCWFDYNKLKWYWYSDRIIELIETCSHDVLLTNNEKKWESKIKKLIKANDKDAWAIVIADFLDNLSEPIFINNKERWSLLLNQKPPVFIYYWNKYFSWTNFYNDFLEIYFSQIKVFNWYFL